MEEIALSEKEAKEATAAFLRERSREEYLYAHADKLIDDGRVSTKPNLPPFIAEFFLDIAQMAWQQGDISDVLSKMDNHVYLLFVACNRLALRSAGMYETAMIKAITTVNMYKAPSILPWLFLDLLRDANRSKLLSLGDDLPSGDRLTVFRGVIDVDDPSRVRRTSWTLSSGIAAWFATVMGRNEESIKPGVFMLNVPKEKVFFYTNKRDEQEVVVDMYPQARPKLVEPMPEPLQPKD